MAQRIARALPWARISVLAGCSLAPPYTPLALTTPTPPAYKETGAWTPASPGDAAPRRELDALHCQLNERSRRRAIQ